MNLRNTWKSLLLAFVVAGFVGQVCAQDKKEEKKPAEAKKEGTPAGGEKKPDAKKDDKAAHGGDAAMAAMMEMGNPGPEHAVLKQLAGNWEYVSKWRMSPTEPWSESKGASKVEVLFDGRYARQELKGTGMDPNGPPFEGRGVTGYDKMRKKYVNMWIDNHGTGIALSYGTADAAGKVITYTGEEPDWENPAKMKKTKQVYRIKDDKTHVFEMYDNGPDGKEYVSLEVTYTKK